MFTYFFGEKITISTSQWNTENKSIQNTWTFSVLLTQNKDIQTLCTYRDTHCIMAVEYVRPQNL